MNKILEKIGQILGITEETTSELQFEDCKDASGNIIRIEKYEVGGKAELISTDGTLIPLTDGEYTLEDGRSFTVTGGVISGISQDVKTPETPEGTVQPIANSEGTNTVDSVKPEDKPADVAPEGDMPEGDMPAMEARVAAIEATLAEVCSNMETMMSYLETMASSTKEFKEVKKQLEKEKEELNKTISDLEKQPAGDPVVIKAAKVEGAPAAIDYGARYTAFKELSKKNKK